MDSSDASIKKVQSDTRPKKIEYYRLHKAWHESMRGELRMAPSDVVTDNDLATSEEK